MSWLKNHWVSLATFLVFCATTLGGICWSYGSLGAKVDSLGVRLTRIEDALIKPYADVPATKATVQNHLPLAGNRMASSPDGTLNP